MLVMGSGDRVEKHTTVSIRQPTYDYFSAEVGKGRITSRINEALENMINTKKILKKLFPGIEEITMNDNVFFLKDTKIDKLVEVRYEKREFNCNVCKHDNCRHVVYAIGHPDVARLAAKDL